MLGDGDIFDQVFVALALISDQVFVGSGITLSQTSTLPTKVLVETPVKLIIALPFAVEVPTEGVIEIPVKLAVVLIATLTVPTALVPKAPFCVSNVLPTWLVPATPVRFTSTPCPSTIVTVPTVELPLLLLKLLKRVEEQRLCQQRLYQ